MAKNIKGQSALHIAVDPLDGPCDLMVIKMLLDSGSDLSCRNNDGQTRSS